VCPRVGAALVLGHATSWPGPGASTNRSPTKARTHDATTSFFDSVSFLFFLFRHLQFTHFKRLEEYFGVWLSAGLLLFCCLFLSPLFVPFTI
jgi:hypothetical protein